MNEQSNLFQEKNSKNNRALIFKSYWKIDSISIVDGRMKKEDQFYSPENT